MRVLVVWCPDWSVVAALREAERPATEPAAVLAANVVEVCNGPARDGGRPARAAAPRRPGALPRAGAARRQPRPRRARLRAGARRRSRRCGPGWPPLRPGLLAVRAPGTLLRRRGQRRRASWPRPWSRPACGTAGSASPTTCSPPSRPPGARDVQECELVARGRLRGVPARPAGRGARGRRRRGARDGQPAAPARAAHPRRPRGPARPTRCSTGSAATARRCGAGPAGEAPTLVAAAHPAARPDRRGAPSSRRSTPSRRSASASARPPSGWSPSWRRGSWWPPGCGSRPSTTAAVASARTWLHPRFFSARDLVDRVHWQLQAGGALRSRQDAGAVRAPVERVRFVPEVVEPAAAHAEGLWGGAGEELVRARRGPGAGDGRVRRRDPAGAPGRAQPRPTGRPRCRGASAPTGLRPLDRPVAGAAAGAGAGPGVRRAAGRRGRATRPAGPWR